MFGKDSPQALLLDFSDLQDDILAVNIDTKEVEQVERGITHLLQNK